jgi:hypothetical integral membrane protein (TIGR02206 family)
VYSIPQAVVIGCYLALYLSLYLLRKRFGPRVRTLLRWAVAIFLVLNELAWHLYNLRAGTWSVRDMLPLHICSVMVFASAILLMTKSYRVYEFQYFLGITAASQVLFTPDAGVYNYPDFRFFQTFLSHGMIIFAALYMTFVEGYRPTGRSLLKVALGMNLYMLVVGLVNIPLESNYLFLMQKAPIPSLLDHLGPWPWYILGMEIVGAVFCVLLYLPFFLRNLAEKHTSRRPEG